MHPPLRRPAGFRGTFRTDRAARAAYSEGAGPLRIVPDAIAIPRDVDDLVRLVREAADSGSPLIPRGAGSGMPGGNIGFGTVVDLQPVDRQITFGTDRIVTVGASTTWDHLERAAAGRGLRLPPNPSSGAFCTIGGMTATNAAGPRSLRFGSIRPWIQGIEVVTADGETGWIVRSDSRLGGDGGLAERRFSAIERFEARAAPRIRAAASSIESRFPHTTKNSAGYALDRYLETGDPIDVVIGSEGTLALVTRIALLLHPLPRATAALLVALDELANLGDVVRRLLEAAPTAIELIDRSLLEVAGPRVPERLRDVEAIILACFEDERQETTQAAVADAAGAVAPLSRFVETALTPGDREALWRVRHAASPALAALPETRRSLQIIEDGCVPVSALGQYVTGVRQAARETGIEIVAFGHAGDGHLHVNALVDIGIADFRAALAALYERVSQLTVRLGGTPSGEHGDGRVRAPLLERVYGRHLMGLFGAVKQSFDPAGILNPGVVLPESSAAPLSHLKVGPGAATIPEAVADGLREMERTGRWDKGKLELLPRTA